MAVQSLDGPPLPPPLPGIPHVEIFTIQPLQLGKPNTLVCSVTNLFPPAVNFTWEHEGQPVTEGVYTPLTYPVQELGFQAFSYLEVTPQESDIYSCTVKVPRDKFSTVAFWGECPPTSLLACPCLCPALTPGISSLPPPQCRRTPLPRTSQ